MEVQPMYNGCSQFPFHSYTGGKAILLRKITNGETKGEPEHIGRTFLPCLARPMSVFYGAAAGRGEGLGVQKTSRRGGGAQRPDGCCPPARLPARPTTLRSPPFFENKKQKKRLLPLTCGKSDVMRKKSKPRTSQMKPRPIQSPALCVQQACTHLK